MLIGPNGAGKTNLIEAISFLVPGRGLRRATLEEVAFSEGDGSWAVSAEVEGALGLATLGTGIEPPAAEADAAPALCRIDREPVGSAAAFADHLRVIWLDAGDGPAVRRAGVGAPPLPRPAGAGGRCRAQSRVNALERALRSRNRLLEDPRPDPHWLDAVEHETAELAVAVAALRAETVQPPAGRAGRSRNRDDVPSRRPRSRSTAGWSGCCRIIPRSRSRSATAACCKRQSRARRRRRPHARWPASHRPRGRLCAKSIPAADASTGEQKALLIGLVLAHAGLFAEMTGFAPVLLLDEVVAHLDPDRRLALYAALARLGAQVFMTGADPAAFAEVALAGRRVHREPRAGAAQRLVRAAEFSPANSSRNFRSLRGLTHVWARTKTMKRQWAGECHVSSRTGKGEIASRPLRACALISTAWSSGPTPWMAWRSRSRTTKPPIACRSTCCRRSRLAMAATRRR